MKKLILSILVSLFSICAFAQKDNKVTIGIIDSLQSKILGEQRKIWVYLPNGDGANDLYSSQKYPVVYLLDGNAHFYSVVGMIQQLSQVNGNTVLPEMIVVGIPNTDRTRDLTPTHMDFDPRLKDSTFVRTSGGGENFISFIEKELMPFVESKYPAAPYKLLIGHSIGGLMVMQTLVHNTHLFNSYICIDPSMWWDNQKLLSEAKMFLKDSKLEGKSFYLGFANTMDEGMDIKQVAKDTTMDTEHIRSILELQTAFENNDHNGLHYKGRYYNDDDHGSVPLIAEYDAFRFIFDFHNLTLGMKDFTDTTTALVTKLENHYKVVSEEMGYKISPPEGTVNSLAYQSIIFFKNFIAAGNLFRMNVENYPNSANVYDSYGDYFLAVGNKTTAIEQFKKALAIKENPESRKKLNALLE
jgi:predicted alpha/beta superfamily hydrolase